MSLKPENVKIPLHILVENQTLKILLRIVGTHEPHKLLLLKLD